MWILPKKLLTTFQSALGTKELALDCEESSRMFEKYVWWRGALSTSAIWLRRWKRENWIKHLFGRIFGRCHSESFEDWWTSSQEGSLANPLAVLESASQTETNDTSTPSSKMELENADLPLFSWKMSKEYSQQKNYLTLMI